MKLLNSFRAGWAFAITTSLIGYTASVTPDRKSTLDRISVQSLEGHISFLASDLLEGRNKSPSPGLDLAAEYIASQFRRAGLKPAGDDDYFQTAHFIEAEQSAAGAELTVRAGDKELRVEKDDLRIATIGKANFTDVAPVKVKLNQVKQVDVEGKVIIAAIDRLRGLSALQKLKPAAVILAFSGAGKPPEVIHELRDAAQPRAPVIRVYDRDFYRLVDSAKLGPMDARISLHLPLPVERPVTLHNVVGVLPGSDPELSSEFVLVTAHYDHLGRKPAGEGDLIYNGANDDASGVASVIEIASALAAAKPAPRRSVLFMTYFGEEKGLLGSRYYGNHPLVPLKKTVADLNLEHLGRTDGDGKGPGTATMTGFGYSDITSALELAGAATGVGIYSPEQSGDDFYARSDNQSLADRGVPATTILTTFEFPDYHKVGDEWKKIDYPNLQKVDRAIALTVMVIADDPRPPHWNEANAKTEKYVRAWQELQ